MGCKLPILAVVGIRLTGEREVLGFCVGDRENQQAWEDLLEDLKTRGVTHIGLSVTNGNQAMVNAIAPGLPQASANAVSSTKSTTCSATFPPGNRSNPDRI